jgi:acetyl esterase/lipase
VSAPTIADRLSAGIVRAVFALPDSVQKLFAGRPVEIDGQRLAPEMQLLLRLFALAPTPELDTLAPAEARIDLARRAKGVAGPTLPVARVEPLEIPSPGGPIRARLYAPEQRVAPPLLVYFHGGGWVRGDLDTHDNVCRFLAREADLNVLSVDYRLAPEDPFPAAVEDALASFRFAVDNAGDLGADADATPAVGGDSAGANLAAVTAQLAAAEGGPEPDFSLLIYPATDFSRKRRSYELFAEGFLLPERETDWYRDHYLPEEAAALDPRASPLLAEDLSGQPPTYVVTAGFDVLRDEGEEYAKRLRTAGVPVALRRHPGLMHGFANMAAIGGAPLAAMHEAAGALRMAFATAGLGSKVS